MFLPEEEKYNQSRSGLETAICGLLAGRVAEELVFGEITSGASNDIERATHIARKMVCEWGMSDKIGPLAFGEKEGEVFLGRDLGHARNYSETTAVEIDAEIRRIVQESYEKARHILESHRDGLVRVAEALLELETIDGEEVRRMIIGDVEQPAGAVNAQSSDDATTVEV
jgi:cell division protease FtsH